MPAGGLWVLKRVPLARNRITLGKSDDETDNGEDVQSDAESQDGHPQPRLWAEDADDQDSNAQLWQGDTEKSPRINEDDPKGGSWDGVDHVGVGDPSRRVKGLLESGHSNNVEYLLDDGVGVFDLTPTFIRDQKIIPPQNASYADQYRLRYGAPKMPGASKGFLHPSSRTVPLWLAQYDSLLTIYLPSSFHAARTQMCTFHEWDDLI
ncbi:MAG: hypothetical protein Q9192_006172 [Flavoplaca navasiana]